MDTRDPEAEPQFSQPFSQLLWMLVVLALVGVGGYLAFPRVSPIFIANPYLNGFIFLVFVIGVLACFFQVFTLMSSVRWIERFASDTRNDTAGAAPRLLAPLATLLRSRNAQMKLGASSTRSILDSVATRIDEAREITRYIVSLLIFLGLLGTFYGLATTVPAVVDTIRSLAPQEGEEGVDIFNRLMTGLEAQLGGMGVAFASSLLGLAGSLVVGLLEIFAGHGQNRFYRELEEWLSSITRIGFSSGEEGGVGGGEVAGFVDHMSSQMEALQVMLHQSEIARGQLEDRLGRLAKAIEGLVNQTYEDDSQANLAEALTRIADGQERLIVTMQEGGEGGIDPEARMRLRSIDVQLIRLLEEISAGRQETMAEIRGDLSALSRTIRQAQGVRPRAVGDREG